MCIKALSSETCDQPNYEDEIYKIATNKNISSQTLKQRNAPNGKCNTLCSSMLVVPISSILMQVLQFQLMMMVVFCDDRREVHELQL